MIMPNMRIPTKCPKCGSERIGTKWTLNTIVAWVSRLMAVSTVKIFDKRSLQAQKKCQNGLQ